jgi:hypothetical protein
MGIKGFVNGHDREPKTWHKYVDEEEGSKEAQCHEAQHASRAPVRAPLRYGAMRGRCFTPENGTKECVLTNCLLAICRDRSFNLNCNHNDLDQLEAALRPHHYNNRTDIQSFSKLGSVLNTSQRSPNFKRCSQKSQTKCWPRNNYRFVLLLTTIRQIVEL